MAETHRHHWKLWFTLVMIVGILGLLFYTDAGKKTLSLFNLGQFIKTVPTSAGPQFPINLNSNIDAFYSQIYEVTNSSIVVNGICKQMIKLNDMIRQTDNTRCGIVLTSFSGSFDYTTAGSIALSGESQNIILDDDVWYSAKPIKIELEVIPSDFILTNLIQNKISLTSVSGSIVRGDKGSEIMTNSPLEIGNFAGSLRLENGTAILSGMTNSVKSQEFSW